MSESKEEFSFFEGMNVCIRWDVETRKAYFSIDDICEVFADCEDGTQYWSVMKAKLQEEGVSLVGIKTKLIDLDGKMREADVVDMEQVFRLIQSIPSKKAEPFKLWLAKVGSERFNELKRSQEVDELLDSIKKELPPNF